MSIIHSELNKLDITCDSFCILQDKDGVTVARIVSNEKSYVIKCFQKEEHKRELENYRLLSSRDIPTIRVIASTNSALLLEDIDRSANYRLGAEEDMSDPAVARLIAEWDSVPQNRSLTNTKSSNLPCFADSRQDRSQYF